MSSTYTKYTFAYNNGWCDEAATIYCHNFNTIDSSSYYDKHGRMVTLQGPDDYLKSLARIILGKTSDMEVETICKSDFDEIVSEEL